MRRPEHQLPPQASAAETLRVFFDADVLIAGAASTTGASHLLLRLAELGVIAGITSAQAVREAEENLREKLPAAVPAFRAMVSSALETVADPTAGDLARARGQAEEHDLPILAAAIAARCRWLATFNVRHYRPAAGTLKVTRPGPLVQRIRRILTELG
jgi:predicted nucleic acid-binding protein